MPKEFANLSRAARSRILRRLPRGENGAANRVDQRGNHNDHVENWDNAERQEDRLIQEDVREAVGSAPVSEGSDSEADDDLSESADSSEVEELQGEESGDEDIAHQEENNDDAENLSDDEDDNINFDFNGQGQANIPLYAGAPITVMESMCLIMSLALKHNLTGACIADLLTVINLHCIQLQLRKLSFKGYKKVFSISQVQANKHFYCSKCIKPLPSADAHCTCLKGVSYFLQFPLLPQLNQWFQRDNFMETLQHRFRRQKEHENSIVDVYDGSVYQQFMGNGFLSDPNNISFLWNSDGVPVYKSRNFSIWPFYLTINELPYKQRFDRKNVLLAGLWFGPKKPQANLFVMSFKRDLEKLYQGVPFQIPGNPNPVVVKAVLLAGTCDLPAKSTFLNFSQFNAAHGCPNCETAGTQVILPSGKSLQVYNHVRVCANRTSANVRQQAAQALQMRNPVVGVKGPTILDRFVPDVMKGMAIDSMRNASGVVKKILILWFDSKYSQFAFSIRGLRSNVDEMLLKLKPPKFIHRMPRSVDELCHWKASVLLVWLYYYSPVLLQGVLRPDFYQHFLKLVAGLSHLSGPSVKNDEIDVADRLLQSL